VLSLLSSTFAQLLGLTIMTIDYNCILLKRESDQRIDQSNDGSEKDDKKSAEHV
jgi:hypothetical protein